MTSSNNALEIKDQLARVAKTLQQNEKFLTGFLVGRAKKLSQAYPSDITCLDMYQFLNQRLDKQALISRSELQSAYHTLCKKADNKFVIEFEQELAIPKVAEPKRTTSDGRDLLKESQAQYADPVLKNAFVSVFDQTKPVKIFSEKLEKQALNCAEFQIKKLNLGIPAKVEAISGNEQFIICRAGFQTPKGEVFTLIPVKVSNGSQALFPESFLNDVGQIELTAENLKNHITKFAGKSLSINADRVLNYLTVQASASQEPISDVMLAVLRMKGGLAQNPYNNLGLVYKNAFDKQAQPIKDIKYQVPEALKPLVANLGSKAGEAEFVFGKQAVDGARVQIHNKLASLGYKNCNIKVANLTEKSIIFAVEVANRAVKVPVTIENKLAYEPKMMIANGGVKPFTGAGIQSVLAEDTDAQILTVAYDLENNSTEQLSDKLKFALSKQDYKSADSILQVLQNKNASAFQDGVNLLKNSLAGKNIEAQGPGCNKLMKTSTSVHPICGHTGLPSNKVYQDKHGNCRPLYRKGYEDQERSAHVPFASNKLYW